MDDVFRATIIALDEQGDPLHRLAYADWLDEQGRSDESYCFRWMARHGKRPFHRLRYKTGIAVPAKWGWGWFRMVTPTFRPSPQDPDPPRSAYLPRTVFAAIVSSDHQFYVSWERAVFTLSDALKQTRKDVEA